VQNSATLLLIAVLSRLSLSFGESGWLVRALIVRPPHKGALLRCQSGRICVATTCSYDTAW
jgi:hypothetical protein